jgi:hypothetical protein
MTRTLLTTLATLLTGFRPMPARKYPISPCLLALVMR